MMGYFHSLRTPSGNMMLEVKSRIQVDSEPADLIGRLNSCPIDVDIDGSFTVTSGEFHDFRLVNVKGCSVPLRPFEKMIYLTLGCYSRFSYGRAESKDSRVVGIARPQQGVSTSHWFSHVEEEKEWRDRRSLRHTANQLSFRGYSS